MQFPLKTICDKRGIRKDGRCNIYIQYCYSAKKRTLLNSGIAIPPEFWDPKNLEVYDHIPVVFGHASEINEALFSMMRKVEDLLIFAKKEQVENPIKFLKGKFTPDFNPATLSEIKLAIDANNPKLNKDFFFQVDNYIKAKLNRVSKDMARIYRNMKDHLKAFELFRKKPITFDDLDFTFYEDLVDFLSYDYILARRKNHTTGLKYNSVGKTIKHLRAFLNDRAKRKIIAAIDMDGWKVLK
ncbi:MAG: phage integrase SAM-like domain and Arm DNA-binding domain-containing protein [Bacteroidota bacterium]